MKVKYLLCSVLLGSALSLSAQQGFKDGVEYYRADQPEEASIILNNTLNDAATDQATAYYYLGQIALQNGDKATAKANFEKGISLNVDNGYNYVGLGSLALANGNASSAASYFKDAKSRAKKDADLLTEIARAYFVADPVKYNTEIDKALADAKKAVKNAPAPFILEGDRVAKTNVGDAAGFYEMAAQFDTNLEHPEAYVKYARTYFHVNPQYAIDKLQELLNAQPNSALAQRELAEKYYDDNQLTRAAQQYEKYIQNPNSFKKDKQRLVGLLFFAKRYNESYDMASELLAEDPTNFYMQRLQFYNKKALGENEAAKASAEKLFNNPKADVNSQDCIQYGELLQDMGQDTLGVTYYEKAVALSPEKTSLLKELSGAYSTAKMYDKAADTMAKFIESEGADANPNDILQLARRYQNLAISYMETDTEATKTAADKALKTINQVIERVPDNPLVLNTKSDILRVAALGEVTDDVIAADKATLEVLNSDPSNLEKRKSIYKSIYTRLGNYYRTHGDNATAKDYFLKFYEIDPSEELKQYIDTL
jgi:tetratricopeptide (TPR) repeat protein